MKKRNPFYLILGCLAVLSAFYPVQAQTPGLTYPVPLDEEHFPDAVFRRWVSFSDYDKDGYLSVEECGTLTIANVLSPDLTNLEGIRYFYALTILDFSLTRPHLTSLDVSGMPALTTLNCNSTSLTNLDVSGCTALTSLDCSSNDLTTLDVSRCTALTSLDCRYTSLTNLDVSGCTALTTLDCSGNDLTTLDVSRCTALTSLDCADNDLTTTLDVSGCTALGILDCSGNDLTALDVSGCTALVILDCFGNDLTTLNMNENECTALRRLDCSNNQLTTLNSYHLILNGAYDMWSYPIISPQYASIQLNDSNLFLFDKFIQNQGGSIENVTFLNDELSPTKPIPLALYDTVSYLYSVAISVDRSSLSLPNINDTIEMEVHLTASDFNDYVVTEINDTHFPDFNFRSFLLNNIDANHNRKLDFSEAYNPEKTNHLSIANQGIKDLTGIAYFPGIGRLDCSGNDITKLDLSGLRYLTALDCSKNPNLSVLEINDNKQLEELNCSGTTLYADFSQYPNLQSLACTDMELDTINLSGNPLLQSLDCGYNHLAAIDLSKNVSLQEIKADNNYYEVGLDDNRNVYISLIPGLDPNRMDNIQGGRVEWNSLHLDADTLTYYYYYMCPNPDAPLGGYFHIVAKTNPEPVCIPIDETHFPDPAFRDYLKLADMNQDGQLNEDEIAGVTGIDVSGLGIQDLRGIGYFTELESLDCSDNQLTSLDLSTNTKLETLKAEGNRLDITLDDRNGFDLSTLPGFDPAKASDWEGCTRIGNLLTFTQQEVTYAYATGYAGSLAGTGLESVRFHLLADRDPSTSNENGLPTQGRVYVQDRVIHTQGLHGEISVFTPTGTLLYRGTDNRIPVGHSGVYIVRNREQVWKVFVL